VPRARNTRVDVYIGTESKSGSHHLWHHLPLTHCDGPGSSHPRMWPPVRFESQRETSGRHGTGGLRNSYCSAIHLDCDSKGRTESEGHPLSYCHRNHR
jgi:hypothetical protein